MTEVLTTTDPTAEPPAYRLALARAGRVLTAEIMDLIDGTVVGIAAPSIRADLGGDGATIQWIAAGYTLAFAVGLITGGRLGDLYGRRRMFLLGLVGFVAASVLCGFAASPEMLIASRVAAGPVRGGPHPAGLRHPQVDVPAARAGRGVRRVRADDRAGRGRRRRSSAAR